MNKFTKQYEGKDSNRRRRRRRRRMEKFRIDEISSVDRPAQSPALSVIMKRDDQDIDKAGDAVDMLTSSEEGHQHGISVGAVEGGEIYLTIWYGGEDGESRHDHQAVINSDGSINVQENLGHTHEIDGDELRNILFSRMANKRANEDEQIPEVNKNAADNGGGQGTGDKDMSKTDNTAELDAVTKKANQLEADLKVAKAFGELTDDQKTYYGKLDGDAKTAFLAKSATERQAELDNFAKADPVVYEAIDGTEYRKSDDSRLVSMAKRADEQHKALIKADEERRDAEFTKRAETELSNLPGTTETHVAMLKAFETIEDETVRTAAFDVLKANNAKMASAFKTVGTTEISKAASGDAQAELEQKAKDYQKQHEVDYYTAYAKVCDAEPDLYAKAMNS